MSEREQQEWIVVKPRKSKRIQKQIKPERIFTKGGRQPIEEHEISTLEEKFFTSPAYHHNRALLSKLIKAPQGEVQVHCLGLGNFSSQLKPYIQLLFLKLQIISLLEQQKVRFKVNVFDPAFSEQEVGMLKANKWSCKQLKIAEKGVFTIFFMPHCERFLHEHVCALRDKFPQSSWLIIGNSLCQYKQKCQVLGETIPLVFKTREPIETKLMDFEEAFNDTYVYEL